MTRLAAIEKGQRFPTQEAIIPILRSILDVNTLRGGSALDICCAKGEALKALTQGWNFSLWGNEVQADIKEFGPQNLDHWVHGPAEFLQVRGHAAFTLFNPPYDQDEKMGRMEARFLEIVTPMIAPGGVIVAIIPKTVALDNEAFNRIWNTWFDNTVCRQYPDELFGQFSQVIIFGTKRKQATGYPSSTYLRGHRSYLNTPIFKGAFTYRVNSSNDLTFMACTSPDIGEAIKLLDIWGVRKTKTWEDFVSNPLSEGAFYPAQPMRPGFVPMLMANGMLTGVEINTPEGPLLVRGYAEKILEEVQQEDGEEHRVTIEREKLPVHIVTLNTRTGELKRYDSLKEAEAFQSFITTNLEVLFKWVEDHYPPSYLGDPRSPGEWKRTSWAKYMSVLHGPGHIPGVSTDGLLGAQAETVVTILKIWQTSKTAILSGKMGVGKTMTSIAASVSAALSQITDQPAKTVIVAPGNTVKKWAREFEAITSELGGWAVVARTPTDIDAAFAKPGIGAIIMSLETAKNGTGWAARYKIKHGQGTRANSRGEDVVVDVEVPVCHSCFAKQEEIETSVIDGQKVFCQKCGAPLFTDGEAEGSFKHHIENERIAAKHHGRAAVPYFTTFKKGKKALAVGFRRAPLAQYISKQYASAYIFIMDEAHKAKGGTTQQGYATQDLISGAQKVMLMTGTLYGGKASTIFYLLYRALPSFRYLFGFNEESRFVNLYGLHEIISTEKKTSRGTQAGGYSYDNPEVKMRELPGCNPGLITLLLPYTAFLRLSDLGIKLPPYNEIVMSVNLNEEQKKVYKGVLTQMYDQAKSASRSGNLGPLSTWMQIALGWCDYGEAETAMFRYKEQGDQITQKFEIPAISKEVEMPKVKAVADDIKEQMDLNRMSIVFFEQVNRRDPIPMFEKAMLDRGLKPWILRNDVKSEDREEEYNEAVKAGYNVFMMNGSLVEMGMDMVQCPNIYRCQANFSPYKVDQQNHRIHRIGQTEYVRIVYVFYDDTLQKVATYLMADKLAAISMFDGEAADGLAAMSSQGSDGFLKEMQKTILSNSELSMPKNLKNQVVITTSIKDEAPTAVEVVDVEFPIGSRVSWLSKKRVDTYGKVMYAWADGTRTVKTELGGVINRKSMQRLILQQPITTLEIKEPEPMAEEWEEVEMDDYGSDLFSAPQVSVETAVVAAVKTTKKPKSKPRLVMAGPVVDTSKWSAAIPVEKVDDGDFAVSKKFFITVRDKKIEVAYSGSDDKGNVGRIGGNVHFEFKGESVSSTGYCSHFVMLDKAKALKTVENAAQIYGDHFAAVAVAEAKKASRGKGKKAKPAEPVPAKEAETPGATEYTIEHNLGQLHIKNGKYMGSLVWMGGFNVFGDDKLIKIALQIEGLAGRKTNKPWTATVIGAAS